MHPLQARRMLLVALVASVALLLGCPGELPRNDGKVVKESAPVGDTVRWPDVRKTSPDTWRPPDGYAPSPFGCVTDGDCFGMRCCPTAWGVRLCAPTCQR